jgi:hypothetical protein
MPKRPPAKFSLADPELPESVISADGSEYKIASDHRTVLSCLQRLSDPERETLDKALFVAVRFFHGSPPPDMWALFEQFVLSGEKGEDQDDPMMDFEQDADVIYTSFRQQYGIDLIRETLHWHEFRMLLRGLGSETKFGELLRIREMDVSEVAEKDRPKFRKIKEMVALHPKTSGKEDDLQAELDRRLQAGEDPTEILKQLQGEV